MAKRRRKTSRYKRMAKRRAKIRKRMHIKPGSRRRIHLSSIGYLANLTEGKMGEKMNLIRGFENAAKLVDSLITILGEKKVTTESKKVPVEKPVSECGFKDLPELPDFSSSSLALDEDFAEILGVKKPVAEQKEPEYADYRKVKDDALYMAQQIREGKVEEEEAHQILSIMVESLDKAVEQAMGESDMSGKLEQEIRSLSSGTIASITGLKEYTEVERFKEAFVDWAVNADGIFENWKDAFHEMLADFPGAKEGDAASIRDHIFASGSSSGVKPKLEDARMKDTADADDLFSFAVGKENLYAMLHKVKTTLDVKKVAERILAAWEKEGGKPFKGTLDQLVSVVSDNADGVKRDLDMTEAQKKLSPMVSQYLETALWSSTDESTPEGGEPMDWNYSIADISADSVTQAEKDCDEFYDKAQAALEKAGYDIGNLECRRGEGGIADLEQLGHDFWLTRNGHGAGFWDGDYEEEVGDILTNVSKEFKEINPYVADMGDESGMIIIESTVYSGGDPRDFAQDNLDGRDADGDGEHCSQCGRLVAEPGDKLCAKCQIAGREDHDDMHEAKKKDGKASFVSYLKGTLIPDLEEMERFETAKDFETLVKFIEGASSADDFSREEFINYLKEVLIPDLKDSGSKETAKDFEKGIKLMGSGMSESGENSGSLVLVMTNVGNPDFGQDPNKPLPGSDSESVQITSSNVGKLGDEVKKYAQKYNLGGGNFLSKIMSGDKQVGKVSWNGKLWDMNDEPLSVDKLKALLPSEESVQAPAQAHPGKSMTKEKKAAMGKSLSGKFVRSGDTDSAKKILKQTTESSGDDLGDMHELTPKLEAALKKYGYSGDIEMVSPEEADSELGVQKAFRLKPEVIKDLRNTIQLFASREYADKNMESARAGIVSFVKEVIDQEGAKAGKLSDHFTVEADISGLDSYTGSEAMAAYIHIESGGVSRDLEPAALYDRNIYDGIQEAGSSWNWAFWLLDDVSPFKSDDFVEDYAYDQAGNTFDQLVATLDESDFATEVKKAVDAILDDQPEQE
jgi:hypothetical protein